MSPRASRWCGPACAAWLAAACAGAARTGTEAQAPAPAYRRGPIPRALEPAQLADPGAYDQLAHGVRVAALGPVWLELDGPPAAPLDVDADPAQVWRALAETADRVQIVSADDHALLALWVQRADLAPVAIDRVEVRARPDAGRPGAARVELRSGAPLEIVARDAARDAARVRYRDELAIDGWVPAAAIGTVFAIDRRPNAALAPASLADGVVIRERPDPAAPALATARTLLGAHPVGDARGAWREVEVATPGARVHGFVPATALGPETLGDLRTTGGGASVGSSGRRSLAVPAGTCLYARPDGEVVGVTTASEVRLVLPDGGWWNVIVGSRWGIHELYLRDTGGAQDLRAARLEPCTAPVP